MIIRWGASSAQFVVVLLHTQFFNISPHYLSAGIGEVFFSNMTQTKLSLTINPMLQQDFSLGYIDLSNVNETRWKELQECGAMAPSVYQILVLNM